MELGSQDQIDDFVMGKLSKEEQQHFYKEILEEEKLKEQFEFARNVMNALINRNQKIAAMKAWERK